MRHLKPVLLLCLGLSLLACSLESASLPTATPLPLAMSPAPPKATAPPKPVPPTPPKAAPTPTQAPTALKRPNRPQIGLNFIRFYWSDARDTTLNTTTPYLQPDWIYKDFRELGVHTFRQFVKADLLWNIVEPQDNQWSWQGADVVLKTPDFEPIVTLFAMQYSSPTPPWANSPAQFQKKMGPEATDYVEAVVKRYAPYVKYWELGNEMDHWRAADPGEKDMGQGKLPAVHPADGFSPREQGAFLAQAAAIIRKYDPDAVIIMPGMGGLDDYCINTWLSGVIEGGGKDWFDVVNYHYYSSWERYSLMRQKLQDVLKQKGIDNKPVWVTETGSTASATLTSRTNYPNSPESQAADIFRRIVQAYGHGDAMAMWHTYIGSGDTPDNDWRLYGIRADKAEAQPAYYAFKLLAQELIPFGRAEKLAADVRGANAYKITTQAGAVKYVVWGNGSYTIPTGMTQMTSVVPKTDGSFNWQAAQAGKTVTLSPDPALIK